MKLWKVLETIIFPGKKKILKEPLGKKIIEENIPDTSFQTDVKIREINIKKIKFKK